MQVYPIGLTGLQERRCVVVGGGAVAQRKVAGLLAGGARVTVVSPALTVRLRRWAAAGRVLHVPRTYRPGDLAGAFLAIAASGDPAVNEAVWREAEGSGVLASCVDDPARSHFVAPAVLRRGELVVSIATSGRSPALAAELKRTLGRAIGREHGKLVRLAGELRPRSGKLPRERSRAFARALLEGRILPLLACGRDAAARAEAEGILREIETGRPHRAADPSERTADRPPSGESGGVGTVWLVGAGPGDPGLITISGRECLERADVVIADRLVHPALLRYTRPGCEVVRREHHAGDFGSVCELMVERARQGQTVVRLQAGDPLLFARGGEELECLASRGIPVRVVPGVSSALAGPACAGIPLTDRRLSSSVALVTGHEAQANEGPGVAWDQLGRSPGTLVILMGLRNLPGLVQRLVEAGRPADTPVAVISNASLPEQRTVVSTLGRVVEEVRAARLDPPAVIVVGAVVALRERLGGAAGR